jgi:3-hydroxybutyryl-CoA dehydrogenase
MGSGIAQVCASKGLDVLLMDRHKDLLERGIVGIKKSLRRLNEKGSVTKEAAEETIGRIRTETTLDGMKHADFIVEAVVEDESVKKGIFQQLDKITSVHTILASNTSSISITKLGSATSKPHRVIGMHFMNPVPIMALVELAKGLHTSQQTYEACKGLAEFLGKQVATSQDRPGFLVNRVLIPMINEAFYCLMENVGTAEDIDKGMRLGTNQPMGPLRLADFIGLDTCLSIMKVLHEGLGDSKYRPCPLLQSYVDAGWLGQKVGHGVYQYDHEHQKDAKH